VRKNIETLTINGLLFENKVASMPRTSTFHPAIGSNTIARWHAQENLCQWFIGTGGFGWWSWGDLNPRPQAFFAQIYMFSGLI
jgi:hypothetical protein